MNVHCSQYNGSILPILEVVEIEVAELGAVDISVPPSLADDLRLLLPALDALFGDQGVVEYLKFEVGCDVDTERKGRCDDGSLIFRAIGCFAGAIAVIEGYLWQSSGYGVAKD